jgi:glycosyltransferase involved in cell wall biosynthesis
VATAVHETWDEKSNLHATIQKTAMASTPDGPTALLLISDLEFGGAQRQVVELANQMDPHRFKMHVCTLADYVPLSELLTSRESRLHVVRKQHKFDVTVIPKLVRLMRDLRVVVVHTFLFDAEFFGRIAARLAGVPAVIGSERNTDYVPLPRHLWAFALTRAWSNAIIANSTAGADFNSRTFGVPRSKYRVIHNGVDTNRFKPRDVSALRKQLGIADHDRVVGMFASFKEQKNHSFLLRAAPRVIARFPDLRLLFIGDELYMGMSDSVSYHRKIHALVDDLGLRKHCLFLGNRSDVEKYYSLCDLTVLPSFSEGTPNVALESMASGVPVVATNVSDNALIIPDGKVGLMVALNDETALADRICRILENKELRTQMGKNARQWVTEHFSGKRLADKTASIYEEVLSRQGFSNSRGGEGA